MKKSLQRTIETYDNLVSQYVQKTRGLEPLPELEKFKHSLPKEAFVLDAGCGWGRDSKILSEKFKVVGIDLSKGLLEYARNYAPKAQFRYEDVSNTGFANETFDGIWCNQILLHLEREEVPGALSELYRLLKKGGIAYISVKEGEGEEYKSEDMSGSKPRFYTWFSQKEFANYLKQAGFTIFESYLFFEAERLKLKRNLGVINFFVKKSVQEN